MEVIGSLVDANEKQKRGRMRREERKGREEREKNVGQKGMLIGSREFV